MLRILSICLLAIQVLMHAGDAVATESREEYWANLLARFDAGDFAALEAIAHREISERRRTEDGLWYITLYHAAFNNGAKSEQALVHRENRLRAWISAFPRSPVAHVALANAFFIHAFMLRGYGYADTVSPERWRKFHDYMALGREILEQSKAVSRSNPTWYVAMFEPAKSESWSYDRFLALLREATDREPAFYETYFAALNYLMPKWGGSREEIARFVEGAVQTTRATEGTGLYARIYWSTQSYGSVGNLFSEMPVTWNRLSESFQDILARYPSAYNLNAYASFACLAGDAPTLKSILVKLGYAIDPKAWTATPAIQQCLAMAAAAR